jgi:predicted SprT family Zn-dependent metalloprotease
MKTNAEKLTKIAKNICKEWGYNQDVIVDLNPRLRSTLGQCYYEDNFIFLNRRFVEKNPRKIVVEVLKHEIIHFRYKYHDKNFKNECKKRGIRVHPGEDINIKL